MRDSGLTSEHGLVLAPEILSHALGQSLEHHLQQVASGQRDTRGPCSHDATQLLHAQLVHDGHGLGRARQATPFVNALYCIWAASRSGEWVCW